MRRQGCFIAGQRSPYPISSNSPPRHFIAFLWRLTSKTDGLIDKPNPSPGSGTTPQKAVRIVPPLQQACRICLVGRGMHWMVLARPRCVVPVVLTSAANPQKRTAWTSSIAYLGFHDGAPVGQSLPRHCGPLGALQGGLVLPSTPVRPCCPVLSSLHPTRVASKASNDAARVETLLLDI